MLKSLRTQYHITLVTFLPLIFFGLLTVGLGGYALQKIPQDLILQRQTALAQVAAAGVAGDLKLHLHILEDTARVLGDHNGDTVTQQALLEERADLLNSFDGGVALLDTQGTVIATLSTNQVWLGMNFAFRDYFQNVASNQSPIFSTVFQDQPSGQDVVVVAVPVWHRATFAGVLAGEFTLARNTWARNLNLLRTPQGGQAYLIDRASTIIYHSDPERIGQSLQEEPELWRMIIAGQPQSMVRRLAAGGERVAIAFAPIPGIGWGVVMEEPWDAILEQTRLYQWVTVSLEVAGLTLALVLLILSIRRVMVPLNALVEEAERVSEGQVFTPLTPSGPPDLQTLMQVFNRVMLRLEEQRAALQQYARQILRSQEEERKRISRDLHDDTVQDLVGLTQRLELCSNALDTDPQAARQHLDNVQTLARTTLDEVRRMSRNLRPFILEDLGLPAALHALCSDLHAQLPDARVHCEIVGQEARLPQELEITAFRVVQEALTNIRKHAPDASYVNVTLFFEKWGIQVMVEDNGCGFKLDTPEALIKDGHLGLAGMGERAQLFGGILNMTSEPGEGTLVNLRLPF
ncbi:MAG: HAMP domain-containing protein [Anaerolineae bacterium]|nr:HAMP domain-containing protein [Anaerolineae bacterium]